jgi:hypothetical protein
VSLRHLLTRAAVLLAVTLVGGLAVVGAVSLHGAGVLAVALAGVVAGCLGAGLARERLSAPVRRAVADAAWRAAVGTVVALLVLAGSAVVAGRAALVLVVLCLAAVALAWRLRRGTRAVPPAAPAGPPAAAVPPSAHPAARRGPHPSGRGVAASGRRPDPARPAPALPARALPPAAGMSVDELSQEWRRTAAVLETGVDATARAQVVRRRGEVLDELERRDPAGFGRWLAGGASADGYPVRHLRGDSAAGPGPA